jgi:predicted GH43/DUF377 family glycosyl hydrolase
MDLPGSPYAATVVRKEQATLHDKLRLTGLEARPQLIAVTGPGGMGKTRLLKDFMADAIAAPGGNLPRIGYGTAGHDGHDYAAIRWALRSLLENEGSRGRQAAKRAVEVMRTVAPDWFAALPVIGGLLRALSITVDVAMRPDRGPLGKSLGDQLVDLVTELADGRPIVLLLDDLQWADGNTAGLIFDICRAAQESAVGILVVAAFRSSGGRNGLPIERSVRSLTRYVSTFVMPLAGFDEEQTATLIRPAMGIQPSAEFSMWLRRRSDGNPLFALELARELALRGDVDAMNGFSADLPDSIEAVLSELLDDLDPAQRRLLDVAAVLGEPVDPADLLAVADLPEDAARQALRELSQRRGLLESARGDLAAHYRFAYDLLPDLLLRALQRDHFDYSETNKLCAEHLERSGDRRDFTVWERLARHWSEAGRLDCAITAVHRAVWSGYTNVPTRRQALLLAERVRRWAVDSGSADLEAQCEMIMAEALQSLSQPLAAMDSVRRAQALASPALTNRASAAQAHALFFRSSAPAADNPDWGDYRLGLRAAAILEPIVADQASGPVRELYVHLLVTALFSAVSRASAAAEWDLAHRTLERAEQVSGIVPAGDWGDWSHEAIILRAGLLMDSRRPGQAVAAYRAAVELARERDNPYWLTASRARLGIALCYDGREDEGLTELKEGMRLERDVMNNPGGVAGSLRALGEYLIEQGRWLEAAEVLLLAENLYLELGHVDAKTTEALLARVRQAQGFGAWYASFRPEDSEWASYAMLWGLGTLQVHQGHPVLAPEGDGWESVQVSDPAVVSDGEVANMVYCGRGRGPEPALGLAGSADGLVYARRLGGPLQIGPAAEGRSHPRLTRIAEDYVLTYTADREPRTARSPDLVHWTEGDLILPHDRQASWPAVILPEPVEGRWWIYFGDSQIWSAWTEDSRFREWHVARRPLLSPRHGFFDGQAVITGPPPVVGRSGIILVYNAIDESGRKTAGQALLSADDPSSVLRRSPRPLRTTPSAQIVATSLVRHRGTWLLYFGTTGASIGVAMTRTMDL